MDQLADKLQEDPNTAEIDLEYNGLTDLSDLLPLLTRFPQLRVLKLAGNRLAALPADLSSLERLEVMDLTENRVKDYEALARSLGTVPNLVEVKVSTGPREEIAYLKEKLISVQVTTTEESEQEADESVFTREEVDKAREIYEEIQRNSKGSELGSFKRQVDELSARTAAELKQAKTISEAQTIKLKAQRRLLEPCLSALESLTNMHNSALSVLWIRLIAALDHCFEDSISSFTTTQPPPIRDLTPNSEFESIEEGNKDTAEIEKLRLEWTCEKAELEKELDYLRQENRKYLDLIVRHSKASAESALRSTRSLSPEVRNAPQVPPSTKGLTLHQLTEFIDELFTAKAKFDQKCSKARLPMESVAAFLETHLTKKFGLKGLKQDWINAVHQAIARYEHMDNDTCVFGLILKHMCDEEFRQVQAQLKETSRHLLLLQLRERNPLKSASDIETLVQGKINGQLVEEEWVYIVSYMYNEADVQEILASLGEIIEKKPISVPTSPKGLRMSREEALVRMEREKSVRNRLAYSEFLQVLLDFQLKGHMKFLSGLQRRYQEADKDRDGYIDEEEFREVVNSLNLGYNAKDMQRLLQLIDPYAYQRITFSQCTALFNSVSCRQETVKGEEQTVSVLQRLALMEGEGMSLD